MLLGTTIVPLVLQNTTQLLPTRLADSVCQRSTVVLSVSSTIVTGADDTVSTSYSIFPVDHYASQVTRLSTAVRQTSAGTTGSLNESQSSDAATTTLSFSSSSAIQSRNQLPSESSVDVVLSPALTSTSHTISGMSLSTTSLSTSLYFLGSVSLSQDGPNLPTGTPSGLIFASQSSMSTVSEQAITTTASSTSIATTTANPVYTCPRDNGMYYSDTVNRVYQLFCNTDELDTTIGSTYQSQLQSCVDACSDVQGCIGVSYTAASGLCSYKSSALNHVGSEVSDSAILADYICPGADGTRLVDSSGSVYVILCDTFFPTSSNISSSFAVSDLASCSEICSDISDCSGFTFQNGSCTTVSSRNSNDGILRINVTTAILIAKRVAQPVSSGSPPYRSTSLVKSLPVDVSRTPSPSVQEVSATFAASSNTVQESSGTVAVTSTIIASVASNTTPSTSILAMSLSSANILPSSSGTGPLSAIPSTAAQGQTPISTTSSNSAMDSTLTNSDPSVLPTTTLTRSGTPDLSTKTSNSIPIGSDAPPSMGSLVTDDNPTIINRPSQRPTVVLGSSLSSATQTFSLSTISRVETSTNIASLPSNSPSATNNGGSVLFRPTLAANQTSSVPVGASSSDYTSFPTSSLPSDFASSANVVFFSTTNAVSYSTVSTASYFAGPSSLPQTNYSCPGVNGEQVQANTGGSYTIGCDKEITDRGGYDYVAAAPDFNDCMTYCDQLPSCTAWTYSSYCYLKTGSSASNFSFQPSVRGAVSGIRSRPAGTSGLPESSATFIASSSASQTTGSVAPTEDTPGFSTTTSATLPPDLPSIVEVSTTIVPTETSVNSEDVPQSTSSTAHLLSSGVDTASDLVSENTSRATTTSDPGTTSEATTSSIGPIATDDNGAASLSYLTSTIFTPSVTDIISPTTTDDTSLLTTTSLITASSAASSPSMSCSVLDNVLDICLDAVITPSVGIGGAVSVAIGSSTITIVDASISLEIAASAAATAGVGISDGTGGVEIGASASMGVSPGIGGLQQSTTATSSPSTSCSAGGNALNICIDAAVTPSIGVDGNAGIAVGNSSTITLVDVSASLAVAPSITAGVEVEISTGTSVIALVANATLGANLGLGSNIAGPLSSNTASTSISDCSADGNVLNVCVDATITASANANLNLNLGPSSSALTLLDASVVVAPSVAAGLDVGLSVGSSSMSRTQSPILTVSTTSLLAGLNLGGQSTASSTSISLSTTTTSIGLLPTSSLALATGLGNGLGQPSSASTVSSTSSQSSSVSTTASSKTTSTSTRVSSTAGLVQSLTGALGRGIKYPKDSPNGQQGFATLVRIEQI